MEGCRLANRSRSLNRLFVKRSVAQAGANSN
jgi:hypothetical protein